MTDILEPEASTQTAVPSQPEVVSTPVPSTPEVTTESVPAVDPVPEVNVNEAPEVETEILPLDKSDEDPIDADPVKDEITALLETPNGPFKLSTGSTVVIRQLKLREFLALLRIITRSGAIGSIDFNFDDPQAFVQNLLVAILFAIPEASDETVDFVRLIVEPAVLDSAPEKSLEQRQALFDELFNPDLEDIINIMGVVVASEGQDLAKLGKRLRAMFTVANKMGVLNQK